MNRKDASKFSKLEFKQTKEREKIQLIEKKFSFSFEENRKEREKLKKVNKIITFNSTKQKKLKQIILRSLKKKDVKFLNYKIYRTIDD